MARHDQRLLGDEKFVCTGCKENDCSRCLDVLRASVGFDRPVCYCKRKDHRRAA